MNLLNFDLPWLLSCCAVFFFSLHINLTSCSYSAWRALYCLSCSLQLPLKGTEKLSEAREKSCGRTLHRVLQASFGACVQTPPGFCMFLVMQCLLCSLLTPSERYSERAASYLANGQCTKRPCGSQPGFHCASRCR